MTTLRTDLGNTRESARRIRFEPVGGITATNVQDAITQAAAMTWTPVTSASYTPTINDRNLLVNFAGPVTINLAASALRHGASINIIDGSGAASTNNISIAPVEPIDGVYTSIDPLVINTDFGGYHLKPNGDNTGWVIMP